MSNGELAMAAMEPDSVPETKAMEEEEASPLWALSHSQALVFS